MKAIDYRSRPRLVFGVGSLSRLGELAREEGFRRSLFVADHGLMATEHATRALGILGEAGVETLVFSDFDENPDSDMVERGRDCASGQSIDSIVGFGGGSSLDCAKGISYLLSNGGKMSDYWGFDKAEKNLLPMIGVPTTAGTGSEAQTYALISDARTHVKMACGHPTAAFKVALLDPELTLTQPRAVTATTGYDALAHAVETYVTTKRNSLSDLFSREAFRLLSCHYSRVLEAPEDLEARAAMQLGAFYAGAAIENSMLGATHACANPLTQHYGTTHGRAISMCLATVVRFNGEMETPSARYRELLAEIGEPAGEGAADRLARHLEDLARAGDMPCRIGDDGVPERDLAMLAKQAAKQWTGRFNPRPFDERAALRIYQWAY